MLKAAVTSRRVGQSCLALVRLLVQSERCQWEPLCRVRWWADLLVKLELESILSLWQSLGDTSFPNTISKMQKLAKNVLTQRLSDFQEPHLGKCVLPELPCTGATRRSDMGSPCPWGHCYMIIRSRYVVSVK